MKLYEVTESLKHIQSMIDEGVPEDQLIDTINEIKIDFEEKAKSILYLIKNLDSDISTIKSEEDRLKNVRQQRERRKKSIIDYLKQNMTANDIKKISNGVVTASIIKPKPMASILDERDIPIDYKKIKTSAQVDKAMVLRDLKEGKAIAGAELSESEWGLTIK